LYHIHKIMWEYVHTTHDNIQCVADYDENLRQISYEYYENLKIYESYEIHMKSATYQCHHIHVNKLCTLSTTSM